MSQQSPAPSSDVAVFGYSPAYRSVMLGCLLGFLLCAGFSAALPLSGPHPGVAVLQLLGVTVFGVFAVLTLTVVRKMWDKVAVDAEGIRYIPSRGNTTILTWDNIATVIANDAGQRIVLGDASGQKTIKLEYQLDDFARLRNVVVARTTFVVRRYASAMTVFHRSWINKGIFLCFAIGFGIFGCLYGLDHPGAALLFLGLATPCVARVIFDPSRLTITPTAVEITSPARTRTIEFAEISSVDLVNIPGRGNVWAAVILNLRSGEPVRLFRFREGSLALHEALRAAWARAQ
jgi:hypothetical protein